MKTRKPAYDSSSFTHKPLSFDEVFQHIGLVGIDEGKVEFQFRVHLLEGIKSGADNNVNFRSHSCPGNILCCNLGIITRKLGP